MSEHIFTKEEYEGEYFTGISSGNLNLRGKKFIDCEFENVNFLECDLRSCIFTGSEFRGSSLGGCKLNGSRFSGVKFVSCRLSGLDFSECSGLMFGIEAAESRIEYCVFGVLKMSGFSFAHCDISETDFSETDLSGSDFSGVKFDSVRFSGVDLRNADFRGASGYVIDPIKNKVKGLKCGIHGGAGILAGLGVVVEV